MGEFLYLPPRAQASVHSSAIKFESRGRVFELRSKFDLGAEQYLRRPWKLLVAGLLGTAVGCTLSPTPFAPNGGSSPIQLSLSCAQSAMTNAGSNACTVTLSKAASPGGVAVNLASNDSAVNVPDTVTVPAGSTSIGFTATVSAVSTTQTATLTASAGSISTTFSIKLSVYQAILTASANSLGFGGVTVMTASAPQSLTLTSSGTAPLNVNKASATGAGFTFSGAAFPVTLNPGQSVTLAVVFEPTTTGVATGSLAISDNASPSTTVIGLSGTGDAAPGVLSSLTCTQASITGAGSDLCTVSLTAAAPAGGLVVNLSSSDSAVVVPSTLTVPAGASTAGFTATVSAVTTAQTARLTAAAGTFSTTISISLDAAMPALTLQSTSVPFGTVNLNTPSTQSVSLTSSGTAALTLSTASVVGSGFSISGVNFPVTLNPGQSVTLYIQFDPTTTGSVTGTVTLTSNASPATAIVNLSGTGQSVSHQVNLAWNAPINPVTPVAGYNVYRATGGSSSYQLLNISPNQATSYTDSAVQSSTSYSYYVTAVDAQGNQSGPSNIATVNIP